MRPGAAIIIGAGIAGMAASVRLRLKGYDVKIIEANPYPGGKLTVFEQDGYRFDAGPSLFTMPQYVTDLFELAGLNPEEKFAYKRKDESCRYFWDDRTRLTAHADPYAFAREAAVVLSVDENMVLNRLRHSQQKYELAGHTFMEKPLHKLQTWITPSVFRAMMQINKLGVFSSMHQENEKYLKHPKLVQLFDRYATYNGSDPYRAPAVLNMIPHLEHGIGTFLPDRGMHQITESIYDLACSLGVVFFFNEQVTQINITENKVTGVETTQRTLNAPLVVSNMDVALTYRKLMPGRKAPERILMQERSSSALIFYWGISRQFHELGLHNIFFSNDYRQEFENIFAGKVPAEDPTIYINITSKDIPADAPENCENWFVMVNVPAHTGQDWESLISKYKSNILHKLSRGLGVNPEPFIATERVLTPKGIETATSSLGGALYGTSSNSRFAAFMRHANESSKTNGLFFCGGSVHPGGGIPLCLLSAKIVSDLIK